MGQDRAKHQPMGTRSPWQLLCAPCLAGFARTAHTDQGPSYMGNHLIHRRAAAPALVTEALKSRGTEKLWFCALLFEGTPSTVPWCPPARGALCPTAAHIPWHESKSSCWGFHTLRVLCACSHPTMSLWVMPYGIQVNCIMESNV